MPLRTNLFNQFPWIGGVNTALDESTIPSNQLTVASNCVFGTRGSRKKREGINFDWDDASNASASIIGLHDFWFGATTRTQRIVSVTSAGNIYSYNGGTRSADLFAGTAWGSSVTNCSMETLNNLCIIAVDGASNVMKKWSGSGNAADLGGTPPVASICRVHLGRLWTNDKTNPDRLHYSTTANPEEWNGTGDSGAIDIGVGDGDPGGITAIFPTFKGVLFVAKKTKLYKIVNTNPEDFEVILVSNGIGCESHNSVAPIDQEDIAWVSARGVHSLQATNAYGDFTGSFLSADIQTTFAEGFTRSRLPYCWGAYLADINSIAFTFTETTYSSTSNASVWLYNIPTKSWYNWPNLSCESMIVATDSDRKRFYFGTNTKRVGKSFNGTNYDVNTSGTNTAIMFQIITGNVYVDGDPYTIKGFKRFVLYYRPVGVHTITVLVKIDNFTTQSLAYSNADSIDLLGSTFVLGVSELGTSAVMGPYAGQVDGYGRSVKVTITQSGTDQEVEIQGFGIEYETAGTQQQIRQGDTE